MAHGTHHRGTFAVQQGYKRSRWGIRNSFARSIGFEVPFIFGFGRGLGEEPKTVITTSSSLALTRCSIHIIPVLVSITVLILNIGNSYLGRGLPGSIIDPSVNIALLQIAAKAQELLIVASVSTVVIHVLRLELIGEEGLPLGIIGGAFLYSSLGYFWTPDFWGAFEDRRFSWSKFRIVGIIVLGGLIAAFAGPSTAVLLVPREQPWPAGGTVTYIPESAETWWPTRLSVQNVSQSDICQSSTALSYGTCPGGGYSALWSARASIDILGERTYISGTPQNLTTGFLFGPRRVDLLTNIDRLPTARYHGNHRGFACETSISGPRLAYAALQSQLKSDWIEEVFAIPYNFLRYGPSLSQYKYFGSMQVTTKSKIPAVRTACTNAQVVDSTNNNVSFPVLSDTACWTRAGGFAEISVADLSRNSTSELRTTWLKLPPSFGAASGGLVIELPTYSEGVRTVIGCTIDARWTSGNMNTYHLEEASNLENLAAQIIVTTSQLSDVVQSSQWVPGYSEFTPVTRDVSSLQIKFDNSWLNLLTPKVSSNHFNGTQQNLTTLESIMVDASLVSDPTGSQQNQSSLWNTDTPGRVNRTIALEWWLALLVVDGLSREGSSKVLGTVGAAGNWSLSNYQKASNFRDQLFKGRNALTPPNLSNFIQESMQITIGGYAYRATSITDYASAGLLMLHILVAIVHTCYLMYTGRSSNSWDSLTELLVLVQNSRPALGALHNTGAGIHDLKTYSRRARVLAVDTPNTWSKSTLDDHKRVELIFEDGLDRSTQTIYQTNQDQELTANGGSVHPTHKIVKHDNTPTETWRHLDTNSRRADASYQQRAKQQHGSRSTSTEQLIQQRGIGLTAYGRIRADQRYG